VLVEYHGPPGERFDTCRARHNRSAAAARERLPAGLDDHRHRMNLQLTLACWGYDRTRPILDGRVKFDGIDAVCLDLIVEETFFRQMRYREFDVSEMSFSSYLLS
jgi:hypothetical protein